MESLSLKADNSSHIFVAIYMRAFDFRMYKPAKFIILTFIYKQSPSLPQTLMRAKWVSQNGGQSKTKKRILTTQFSFLGILDISHPPLPPPPFPIKRKKEKKKENMCLLEGPFDSFLPASCPFFPLSFSCYHMKCIHSSLS